MAGFLRKKVKQDPQTKPSSAQSVLPSPPTTTPLFARFATTSKSAQEAPRLVSSPMLLSSTRREVAAPLQNQNESRGSRAVAHAAVQSQRDAETRAQRVQSYGAGTAHDIPTEQGNRPPAPRQQSPTQVRARPVSRVPMLDKPLPPSFESSPSNANTSPSSSAGHTRPLSAEHPSPIQGEYAHLWSIIAGDDKELPQPAESPSTNPIPVPRKVNEAAAQEALRSNHTAFGLASPPVLVVPTPRPAAYAGSNPLPQPPSGAQKPTPPIASSFGHTATFSEPDHVFRSQTLTSQPSSRSLSRQGSLADESVLRLGAGASTSRTTLLTDDTLYEGQAADVFGSRTTPSSYEPRSNSCQGPMAPGFSSNEGFDSAPSPTPSSSPKANRKLSKAKPGRQRSTSPPSRLSAATEEQRTTFTRPLPSRDDPRGSHHPEDTMGVNHSALDVSALQQSYNGMQSQDMLPNNQRRTVSPPPQAHVSPQQRMSMSYAPTTPPRKSPSMRSMNGPVITGKPLIFSAMAGVDSEAPEAPLNPPPVAQALAQTKIWSNVAPPPQQQYSSPPRGTTRPARNETLQSQHHERQESQSRPLLPVINDFTHLGPPALPFTHQGPVHPAPPPKALQATHVNGSLPSLPPVEQHVSTRQSPSRTRRLSKARAQTQSSSDFSTQPRASTTSGPPPRAPSKARPTTPISPGQAGPIQIDGDALGVPLDDDPFAKVEGVKMLNPVSRPASPSGTNGHGAEKRHKSRDGRKESGGEELLSDAGSRTESTRPGSSHANASPSPESAEKMLAEHTRRVNGGGREVELQTVTPPVIDGLEGAQDRLTGFLADPQLLGMLLAFLSFYDWCMILSLSREVRFMVVQSPLLRETVLERFLKTVGYARWAWNEPDPLSLSLQDLNDYMRGVSTPTHEYARVAALYVHSLSIHPSHRDQSLYETVRHLAASTRAYSRVVLRLRAQAEKEAAVARARGNMRTGSRPPSRASSPTFSQSNHSTASGQLQRPPTPRTASATFQSPLFRLKRAPLLRVFVPSPDGDWLSDKSVLECEGECRRAGVMGLMRMGDVVWDVAVGDEGNVGRLVWDGSYLIDLDYTYSPIGDLPKYMPTLGFPPSYFHRVIRTGPNSSNPIVHINLSPWGEEIAANLQLLQDRVRTETPQGAYHNVVRWVHRSSFVIRPPIRGVSRSASQYTQNRPQTVSQRIPIPDSNMVVDPGWYGTIVVETEGTNESLADLQDRCGPGAFPPRPQGVTGPKTSAMSKEGKVVYRILREKSRPGEIWIRTVSPKERLL